MRAGWRVRAAVAVVLCALVTVADPIGILGASGAAREVAVVVRHDGHDLLLAISGRHPTAADALRTAGLTPRDGRLLAVVSRRSLDDHHDPARVLLDGVGVAPDTRLPATRRGHTPPVVELTEPQDAVEPTLVARKAVAAPGLPAVERSIWRLGVPGQAVTVDGTVSHEEITRTVERQPTSAVKETEKVVMLTFDDGPTPPYTAKILAILAAAGVHATFCTIGQQVPGNVALVRQESAAGHATCNHTQSHDQRLNNKAPAVVESQIAGGLNALVKAGVPAPIVYRPPGGTLSPTIVDTAHKHCERVLHWDVDPQDWRKPGRDAIVSRVLSQVHPGAVILMHDGGGDRSGTVAALPVIIDNLKTQGYRFTTPTEVPPAGTPWLALPPPPAAAPAVPAVAGALATTPPPSTTTTTRPTTTTTAPQPPGAACLALLPAGTEADLPSPPPDGE